METRTKNSSRNMIFSMIAYIIQIMLGFFVRRYFIFYFNEEYLGLNSLFSNVLTMLSLVELGVGSAIVFSMYKPMADNNKEKVRELLAFYKKCYTIIGIIVFLAGLCVLPFMDYFIAKAPSVNVNLYVVYLIYLFNSVISYFFAYRRSLLYTSQRTDIESKINIVMNIFLTGFQLIAICLLKNFYTYIGLVGVFSLLNNLLVYIITEKKFKEYTTPTKSKLDNETVKDIKKNVFALIFHKLGGVIVFSTDSLIVFFVLGSSVLGKYSNYLLITSYVGAVITLIISSISGSIGNSIASESVQKNRNLFDKLNYIYMFIVSFATICIYVLSDAFIDVVLTKAEDVNLLLNSSVLICVCINFYLSQSRNMCNAYKNAAGLFYQDRLKPIFESVINLGVSIFLAIKMGLMGVVIGTIVSTITTSLWIEPYVLNKHYLKDSTKKYFLRYAFYTLSMVLSCGLTWYVCSFIKVTGLMSLILKFLVCGIVAGISLVMLYVLSPEFKSVYTWIKGIIVGFIKRKPVLEKPTPMVDINGDGMLDIALIEIRKNVDNSAEFENGDLDKNYSKYNDNDDVKTEEVVEVGEELDDLQKVDVEEDSTDLQASDKEAHSESLRERDVKENSETLEEIDKEEDK